MNDDLSDDLSPVSSKDWGWYDFLSYWMTDVHSVGGYIMAGTLFTLGLSPGLVFVALVVGSLLVCVFATLVGVPSQRAGVPFAVVVRRAFGRRAGMVPAAIRAMIAMAWYGIQTWLASNAVCLLLVRLWPFLTPYALNGSSGFAGLSALGWVCFLMLWTGQLLVFRSGIETIRRFFDLIGPVVYVVMLVLLVYLFWCNHWHWPGISFQAGHGQWLLWANATALVVSYFSGPMLNFGDYARKGRSVRDIALGNFLGLPFNFVFFAAIAVATTALTVPVFGVAIDDPVAIVAHIGSPTVMILAILTFLVAATGINISANFVSGVLDLCVLAPRHLDWRRSAWIFGLGAIVLMPWRLYESPARMHATLDVLAAVIGPVFGILVMEYYVMQHVRRRSRVSGRWALLAMAVASGVALLPEFVPGFEALNNFSWFVGFILGAGLYGFFVWMF